MSDLLGWTIAAGLGLLVWLLVAVSFDAWMYPYAGRGLWTSLSWMVGMALWISPAFVFLTVYNHKFVALRPNSWFFTLDWRLISLQVITLFAAVITLRARPSLVVGFSPGELLGECLTWCIVLAFATTMIVLSAVGSRVYFDLAAALVVVGWTASLVAGGRFRRDAIAIAVLLALPAASLALVRLSRYTSGGVRELARVCAYLACAFFIVASRRLEARYRLWRSHQRPGAGVVLAQS